MASAALPANILQFARILRRAGLPVGTGKVIDALNALQQVGMSRRDDVYWALHAVLVDRHAQSELFTIAFNRFWRATESSPDTELTMLAQSAPAAPHPQPQRISEAFGDHRAGSDQTSAAVDESPEAVDAVASWSASERLRAQDFETMSAAEWSEARRLIATLRLPIPSVPTRRFEPGHAGERIDMRRTLRTIVRNGGVFDLTKARRQKRHPPLVVLCDISGSMAAYSRMLLHFVHAVTNDRDRVHVFLFGTRLTNITRALSHRDPDVALARVSRSVQDWGGGTRIGEALAHFNRLWARRALGQGAAVLLITDGLDRDGADGLGEQMDRLHRSTRNLIWLNPLLRYAGFEPKSQGVKAMLPHVDDFRPVHNLNALADIVAALSSHHSPSRRPRPMAA